MPSPCECFPGCACSLTPAGFLGEVEILKLRRNLRIGTVGTRLHNNTRKGTVGTPSTYTRKCTVDTRFYIDTRKDALGTLHYTRKGTVCRNPLYSQTSKSTLETPSTCQVHEKRYCRHPPYIHEKWNKHEKRYCRHPPPWHGMTLFQGIPVEA